MIARITLDVAGGTPNNVTIWLIGFAIMMIVIEGGILALFGMRPVGKAFTSSFLVNMAALGSGFVLGTICEQLGLDGWLFQAAVFLGVVGIQGLILSANRENLTRGRAWFAAFTMKIVSLSAVFAFVKLLDI
ncbi:MAG: hypothetical protein RLZZ519_687 [Bacteroidota bacterium]|jgi:hypothetical protein